MISVTSIKIITKSDEQSDIVIRTKNSNRSIVYGVVLDEDLVPLKDAVAKLFEIKEVNGERNLYPISYCFTDENGEFLFGPLNACKCYFIKVWSNSVSNRHNYFEEKQDEMCVLEKLCN